MKLHPIIYKKKIIQGDSKFYLIWVRVEQWVEIRKFRKVKSFSCIVFAVFLFRVTKKNYFYLTMNRKRCKAPRRFIFQNRLKNKFGEIWNINMTNNIEIFIFIIRYFEVKLICYRIFEITFEYFFFVFLMNYLIYILL